MRRHLTTCGVLAFGAAGIRGGFGPPVPGLVRQGGESSTEAGPRHAGDRQANRSRRVPRLLLDRPEPRRDGRAGDPQRGRRRQGGRGRQEAEHPRPLGRRHRLVQRQLLQPRRHGLPDAEHRPHRQGRRPVHRLVRPAELHRRPRGVHHRPVADPHRPHQGRPARLAARLAEGGPDHRRAAQAARLRDAASSARTTWAIATSSCPRSTASTSSSATSTTSTRRRSRRTPTIRRTPNSRRNSARAACFTPGPRTWTTRPSIPQFGKVGKQKIEDTGPLTKKRMETVDEEITDGALEVHRQGPQGRQAVLRLVERHAHAHLDPPATEIRGQSPAWASIRTAWSNTTARSASSSRSSTTSASPTTPSSCTPPTTARR